MIGSWWIVALLILVSGERTALAQDGGSCAVAPELAKSRPGPDGEPTEVTVGLYLIDLRSIDDSKQSFNADVHLSLGWNDPRLVSETLGSQLVGCRVPLHAVWHPRAQILNDLSLRQRGPDLVMFEADGTLRYNQRYSGDFSFEFFFGEFPFDSHEIEIEIVSFGYGPEEVAFIVDAERSGRETLSIAEWTSGTGHAVVEPLFVEPAARELSRIIYRLEVSRKIGYYFWKVFVPLSLIVMMSWAVFWINPKHLAAQIGIATSAVFTLIAFQFSLGYTLPRLSYLTQADVFVMGSMVLVFLAFGEAVLTGRLADQARLTLAQRIDRQARWLFPLAFVAVISWSFLA